MKYKCYLCGDTIDVDEQVDIDYYNKCKYPTCFNCYIKITDVIMDEQFNELIHKKKKTNEEKKMTDNENIITIPIEKIDMTVLMSIWYGQLQPLLFSERVIDGKRCIDFEKVRKVNFKVNPTAFNVKARKKLLDRRGI